MPITYDAVKTVSAELYNRSLRRIPSDALAALRAAQLGETNTVGRQTIQPPPLMHVTNPLTLHVGDAVYLDGENRDHGGVTHTRADARVHRPRHAITD